MMHHILRSRPRNLDEAQRIPGIFNCSTVLPHCATLPTGCVDAAANH